MESHIVRIYRRSETTPKKLVGVVKEVEDAGKRPFTTAHELWRILNPGKKARKKAMGGLLPRMSRTLSPRKIAKD